MTTGWSGAGRAASDPAAILTFPASSSSECLERNTVNPAHQPLGMPVAYSGRENAAFRGKGPKNHPSPERSAG